jgi:hypothetical protein
MICTSWLSPCLSKCPARYSRALVLVSPLESGDGAILELVPASEPHSIVGTRNLLRSSRLSFPRHVFKTSVFLYQARRCSFPAVTMVGEVCLRW